MQNQLHPAYYYLAAPRVRSHNICSVNYEHIRAVWTVSRRKQKQLSPRIEDLGSNLIKAAPVQRAWAPSENRMIPPFHGRCRETPHSSSSAGRPQCFIKKAIRTRFGVISLASDFLCRKLAARRDVDLSS
ncbi:hypothetical protein NDU88_004674 [Pleurodeles waltl]|uniref:Uncharacterized protein n=1 Tax=Pleurodeles waltl TaxID=8319 RepID=A0AAV7WV11_PLEWA|nr:hypothetical protein NDU88_004674 [Pleurodeles waltl]